MRRAYRGLFGRILSFPAWLPVKHAMLGIDPASADCWTQSGAADGACPCPGVEARNDETGNMLRGCAVTRLSLPFLPKSPSGPQQARHFVTSKPAFACDPLGR